MSDLDSLDYDAYQDHIRYHNEQALRKGPPEPPDCGIAETCICGEDRSDHFYSAFSMKYVCPKSDCKKYQEAI